MPDIAMCRDVACPQRETCYRYRAFPCGYQDPKTGEYNERQSYFAESPRPKRGKCKHHWDAKQHDSRFLRPLEACDNANAN